MCGSPLRLLEVIDSFNYQKKKSLSKDGDTQEQSLSNLPNASQLIEIVNPG